MQPLVVSTLLVSVILGLPGFSVQLQGLVFTVIWAFEKQASAHNMSQIWWLGICRNVAVQAGLQAVQGCAPHLLEHQDLQEEKG